MLVELPAGHAGLDGCIEVANADPQDLVHPRDIDTDAAPQRRDMTFQAGATAKRDNRYFVSCAYLDDLAHLSGRLREGDSVRRYTGMIGGILAMLLAHRCGGRQAVAEQLMERCDRGIGHGGGNGFSRDRQGHRIRFAV